MGLKYDNTNNVQYAESMWDINGIKQYVLLYPKFESDRLMIHLHGGPGEPNSIYIPLFFPSDLPCSLLFYDQRGSGKTLLANNLDSSEVTLDTLVEDLYQTIIKAKEELKVNKVILNAHSFGGILALAFLKKYPSVVDAYIGVSQIISTSEAEKQNFDELYSKITKMGYCEDDRTMIKELKEDNFPYIEDKDLYLFDLRKIRFLSNSYNRSYIDMPKKLQLLKSYTFKLKDYKWFNHPDRTSSVNENLLNSVINYKVDLYEFKIPVFFITGETDYIAPSNLVLKYLESVKAPISSSFIIPSSGHRPQFENKYNYLKVVCKIIDKLEEYFQNDTEKK